MSFQQNVEGFANLQLPESTQIIDFAQKFTSLTPNSPVVISYQKKGYESLVTGFRQIVLNRQLVEGLGTQPGLADKLVLLDTLQNQIRWLEEIYQTYNTYTDDSQLIQNFAQVNADYTTLIGFISNMIDVDPTQVYSIPSLPSIQTGTPQLNYQWVYSPVWGGGGGGGFIDVRSSWIPQQVTLGSIQLQGGWYLDQARFTYEFPSGPQTFVHGGNGGSLDSPLTLQPNEFISEIAGTYGDYINQLTFTTSTGQQYTYPQNPHQGAYSFDWKVPDGWVVVCFKGGSGDFLDSLQACCLQLQPAIWK